MSHSQEPVQQHDSPANGYESGGWYPDAPVERRRRPWRRTAAVGALTVLAVVAAGVPLGLLWSWLSPAVPVVRTSAGTAVVNDPSPEEFIAADGWFTIVGFVFGVLAAVAVWLIVRRHRGPVLLLSVVLGALGAALVTWQVGRRPGLGGWERWQATAAAGDTYNRPPDLHAYGALLVPAFAAVIVCTLLAGWSNDPDLDAPGAKPGYGRDLPAGDPYAGNGGWGYDPAHQEPARYQGVPDQGVPDQDRPDQGGPDHGGLNQGGLNQGGDQGGPHQDSPDQLRPDRSGLDGGHGPGRAG